MPHYSSRPLSCHMPNKIRHSIIRLERLVYHIAATITSMTPNTPPQTEANHGAIIVAAFAIPVALADALVDDAGPDPEPVVDAAGLEPAVEGRVEGLRVV